MSYHRLITKDIWNLKPYHELERPESMDLIRTEVLAWLDTNTDFLINTDDPRLDRQVDRKSLFLSCPSLAKYMYSLQQINVDAIFLVIPPKRKVPLGLHCLEGDANLKINFPICNTENSVTEWFDIPHDVVMSYPFFRRDHYLDNESDMPDLRELDPVVQDLYPLRGSYNMLNNPIIFNASIPHRARLFDGWKFPRIILSLIPLDQESLVQYLR